MARFCPNCGTQMDEVAKFCAGCGTQIPGAQPQPYIQPQPYAPPPPPPPARKKSKALLIALGATVLVIALITLVAVLGKDDPSPAPIARTTTTATDLFAPYPGGSGTITQPPVTSKPTTTSKPPSVNIAPALIGTWKYSSSVGSTNSMYRYVFNNDGTYEYTWAIRSTFTPATMNYLTYITGKYSVNGDTIRFTANQRGYDPYELDILYSSAPGIEEGISELKKRGLSSYGDWAIQFESYDVDHAAFAVIDGGDLFTNKNWADGYHPVTGEPDCWIKEGPGTQPAW